MPALSLLFFFVIERSGLMALVFYNKGMLEKVTMQRTQQFSDFFNTERTPLNAVHAQLLEKLRPIAFAETCRFLTIQSLEFREIWQKDCSQTTQIIYHEKSEFWHFSIIPKTIYGELRKSPMSKLY